MNRTTNVNDPCPVLRATSPPKFLWSFLSLHRTKNVAAKLSRSLRSLLARDKHTANCSSTCQNTAHSHPNETCRLEVFMGSPQQVTTTRCSARTRSVHHSTTRAVPALRNPIGVTRAVPQVCSRDALDKQMKKFACDVDIVPEA